MEIKRDYKLRIKDEERLAALSQEDPQVVMAQDHPQFIPRFFEKIGIDYAPNVIGNGYIKLIWSDFIVEEINAAGKIISIEPKEEVHDEEISTGSRPKTEADLVKQGMPTLEAVERIAEQLHISLTDISFAGIKDSKAITSQELSFNGLLPENLSKISLANIFLKNIHQRKGVVDRGSLYGNRFTIHVRTGEIDKDQLARRVEQLNINGFYNFFSLQRFGTRLLTHEIGRLIMQGKYEFAVKMFLVGQTNHELKVFQNVRKNAEQYYGDWEKMAEIFAYFPYFFYYELTMLETLKETSGNMEKALASIEEQTRFACYAYMSYWYNKLLSYLILNNLEIPASLPLLRPRDDIKQMYRAVMSKQEMDSLKFHHPGLLFLSLNRITHVATRMKPHIWSLVKTDCGYIFHFDLEKGAYATQMLAEVFNLYQGKPLPGWVKQDKCDTRAILGYEPVGLTELRFPQVDDESKVLSILE